MTLSLELPRQVAATITANGALVAGKHTPVDATTASITVTLPASANPGASLSVEKIDSTAHAVTVSGTIRGVTTTTVLSLQHSSITFTAEASGTSWTPTAGRLSEASVSATYVPFGPASPNPAVNTSWLDSTTSPPTLKGWNGTAWVAIGGSSGAAAIDNGDGTITFSTGTPTLSNTTLPAITGTAAVGNTLTASTGAWSTTPDSYTYQWFRNGSAISGATASTYMLVSADASTSITIAVTATKASYTSSTATSAAASVAALALSNTVAPTITGTAQTGQVLSVSNGTWNATPDSYTYQWQRAGGAIPGATASTYTLVVGDVSQAITCIVSATKAGYTSASATSNIVTPSAPGATITTTDNGDGTFSTTGSAVTDNGDGTYTATGSAVTDNGDGTYTLAA